MAAHVEGVKVVKKDGYALCHISDLSTELQVLLRNNLTMICYGISSASSDKKMYNYKNTLKEFLARYENKTDYIKKGMIGELLVHLIINTFFTEYSVASPFFNLEERSIKKGFDVILTSKADNTIWITEVKSGELHSKKNANETTIDLLNTAKNDLYERLNTENHSLWLNAINDAKCAYDKYSDLKKAVVDILEQYGDDSIDSPTGSNQIQAFLISSLFASLNDPVIESNIKDRHQLIKSEKGFKAICILSIQKNTYDKVYQFLKREIA